MPYWFGSAVGSAIGLIAILAGALYNAKLTRRRDQKIMDDEAKAIAAAIGAEMHVFTEIMCGLFLQVLSKPDPDKSMGLVHALRAPDLIVWPALAGKVGLLGAERSAQTVRSWMMLSMHARFLQATIDDILTGKWDEKRVRSRISILKMDLPAVGDTVEVLTGHRPDALGAGLP